MRADTVTVRGDKLVVRGRIGDSAVLRRLEDLSGAGSGWGRAEEIPVTHGNRSGVGRTEDLEIESRSGAFSTVTVTLAVDWAAGADPMRFGTSNYEADDLVEIALRVALLGDSPPPGVDSFLLGDIDDPLAALVGAGVPESAIPALARLLVVEYLVGGQRAGSVEAFSLGPAVGGQRRIAVSWLEPKATPTWSPACAPLRACAAGSGREAAGGRGVACPTLFR
jgi:hypothetical protein